MAWPTYRFLDLSQADKHARRQTLERYALYAQLSALVPVAVILLCRLAQYAAQSLVMRHRNRDYDVIPSSPVLKERRSSAVGTWRARARRATWWLGGEHVVAGWHLGQRDQWIVGISWAVWLLLLSLLETGEDYLHLTKRLGIVAVSQYPLQYLLALKSLNPVAYLMRSSHEQVNRWHRVLARVTSTLLSLHVALYLNFFVQTDRLGRLTEPVVLAGITAFIGLNLVITTALRPVRRFSYRLFFIIHVVAGFAIPICLVLHAGHAKIYPLEAISVFVLDLVARKLDTVTGQAVIESIPGTNLVKITASIPHTKVNRFRGHPGSHIYLTIPAAARKSMSAASVSQLLFEFLFNPFTVAAVDEGSGDLTLVARHLGGPMTAALGKLASAARASSTRRNDDSNERIPLSIEGPYGPTSRFPRLCTDFDRILLVAGGVGATFTLPLYRAIKSESPGVRVEMVWAIRGAGDATWAVTGSEAQAVLKDDNIHIFITGNVVDPEGSDILRRTADSSGAGRDGNGEVEMTALYRDRRRGRLTAQHNRRRPDLKKIVDDVFKHGQAQRVAVFVCGPSEMAWELREHVGAWVNKGRSVWWHSEGFGF